MFRSKETVEKAKQYREHNTTKGVDCTLCKDLTNEIIEETDNFYVVVNLFPYSYWDSQGVKEHLMLIPKQHIGMIDELSESDQVTMMKLLAKYERLGYNIYKRSVVNAHGSIPDHIHWHLLMLDERKITEAKFQAEPYSLEVTQ